NITGSPSRQTISWLGSNRVTLTLKVLPGASGTCIFTTPPGPMSPSMLVSMEFQRTISSTSVRTAHTLSGGPCISAATVHRIRKVDRVFTALISGIDIPQRVDAGGAAPGAPLASASTAARGNVSGPGCAHHVGGGEQHGQSLGPGRWRSAARLQRRTTNAATETSARRDPPATHRRGRAWDAHP